jgi:hypothetical protein
LSPIRAGGQQKGRDQGGQEKVSEVHASGPKEDA